MADILQRLKQHKLVQWAVAYVAAAWVVLQVLDLIFGSYNWPKSAMHVALGVLAKRGRRELNRINPLRINPLRPRYAVVSHSTRSGQGS